MKIGLLTYHRAHNYGGVLQCYALTKAIKKLGYQVEVVDYQCEFFKEQYKEYSLFNLPKIKMLLSILVYNGNVKYNGVNFERFVEQYLPITSVSYSKESIKSIDDEYDILLTGSDQVWSPFCSAFDTTYFLDFSNQTKKCAYAASFGVDSIDTKFDKDYTELFKDFSNVSLREESGASIYKSFTGKEEPVVLDPTLLLGEQDWQELIVDEYKNRKYVLVYMIAESKNTLSIAKSIAKEKGLEVIYISDRLFKRNGVITLSKVKVTDWISLFYYAEYIVTNSFHGIAFSIVFKKDFYVQFLPGRAKTNTRISTILNKFDLGNRLLNSDVSDVSDVSFTSIQNYSEVTKELNNLRLESLNVLSKTLLK
ncbi:polysaccharide pyruvyl transferase family protein [Shewanella sp. KX20019]|uniref:polysaccharide pyruvyl transferase family protein n=1 Tax=Shewanella sp. KX20019 TaxID=2803864 RepID=UPI001928664D|nr:polysaccharide pyruvyl transferase family protein [Shewanella sp. KX20019]QQX81805.1 polysaccharide pyruvyl transferase family protein [Shewanella sp. KX20019]